MEALANRSVLLRILLHNQQVETKAKVISIIDSLAAIKTFLTKTRQDSESHPNSNDFERQSCMSIPPKDNVLCGQIVGLSHKRLKSKKKMEKKDTCINLSVNYIICSFTEDFFLKHTSHGT